MIDLESLIAESETAELYTPLRQKKRNRTNQEDIQTSISNNHKRPTLDTKEASDTGERKTLLETSHRLRATAEANKKDGLSILKEQEERILAQIALSLNTPLTSVKERAHGIKYNRRIKRSWKCPEKYRQLPQHIIDAVRDKFCIDVTGSEVLPPFRSFKDMRLPLPILKGLTLKRIDRPTQIQMQALPCVLEGRDLIGIAFTGSGKTTVFILPMIMLALECELAQPIVPGEGPIALSICPSRELAAQTLDVAKHYISILTEFNYPTLRALLMIGGQPNSDQIRMILEGIHLVFATPGRLNDFLNKRRISLNQCKLLCFDEADRMIDMGFEEEVRNVFDSFGHQRQTLLFSATMPTKIQEFARTALVDPVTVNVGRAGAANLDVLQEVEYVRPDAKLPYLLRCLEKTPPPVVIFCENKKDTDEVHEYLLLKGIDACAIHGGLAQNERYDAIKAFRDGKKDVLVGTDVASKGLDFPAIRHIINYDLPKEIENYIHRIGRTGRCGRTGVATTFVNKNIDETVLLDLKALLIASGQKVPPFLQVLDASGYNMTEIGGIKGCAFCGGLGHRIAQCTKLESQKKQLGYPGKDYLTVGSRYGGTQGYAGDW